MITGQQGSKVFQDNHPFKCTILLQLDPFKSTRSTVMHDQQSFFNFQENLNEGK
jgi:hypothetical protein